MEQHEACAAALLDELGIRLSCNLICTKQAKCSSAEVMSVLKPDGIPTLLTGCGYTKWEAMFAMPLAAFALQRELGIKKRTALCPLSKGTCPPEGMGRESGWMGRGNAAGIILLSNFILITSVLILRLFRVAK